MATFEVNNACRIGVGGLQAAARCMQSSIASTTDSMADACRPGVSTSPMQSLCQVITNSLEVGICRYATESSAWFQMYFRDTIYTETVGWSSDPFMCWS